MDSPSFEVNAHDSVESDHHLVSIGRSDPNAHFYSGGGIGSKTSPSIHSFDDSSYENDQDAELPGRAIYQNSNGTDENYEADDGNTSSENSLTISRLNKHDGLPDAWRCWTRQERQQIAALETIRARDLAVHLFNAFALKRRARKIREDILEKGAGGGINDGESFPPTAASSPFVPPKGWTAWPMPSDMVPRENEDISEGGDDTWTLKRERDWRPSAELEECLTAHMLKTAKEKFERREWDLQPSRGYRGRREKVIMHDYREQSADSKGYGNISGRDPNVELRPVIQADDEKSTKILRPSARHILARLDELLLNLHHSRQAYATSVGAAVSEPETEAESGPSRVSNPLKKRKTSHGRSKFRGRSPKRRSTADAMPVSNSETGCQTGKTEWSILSSSPLGPQLDTHRSRAGSGSRSKRQERLGLRDWSDVVGIASMTGWPELVVMRTAQRCAEFFDEDMVFRTLGEGKLQQKQTEIGTLWEYTEAEVVQEPRRESIATPPDFLSPRGKYATYCPVERCPRHTKGFSRVWNLNQHLKKKHPGVVMETAD